MSQRFWSKVEKTDGCWLWKGAMSSHGYGTVTVNQKRYRAHRLAYELTNGPIPTGLQVMHVCDVPACVNPAHLRLGTVADNIGDAVSKGRVVPPVNRARGECANSKLTWEQVRQLRKSSTPYRLGRQFGVSKATIFDVMHGKSWKEQ